MTDWGAHHNDIALWAIGLPGRRRRRGQTSRPTHSREASAYSEYEVKFTYANGVVKNVTPPRRTTFTGAWQTPRGQRNGIRFEGSNGWLWVNRNNLNANNPELIKAPLPENAERVYASDNHMGNFFGCIRSRKLPICDVKVAPFRQYLAPGGDCSAGWAKAEVGPRPRKGS